METVEIPLYREELQVGKRVVSDGGVLLRKIVETETQSEPVQLRREDIVIERVSANEARNFQAGDSQRAFQDREVVIELSREVPTLQKHAIVTEVVRARTVVETQPETVSGTVREESINIDRSIQDEPEVTPSAVGGSPAAEQGKASESQQVSREAMENAELFLHKEQLDVGKRVVPGGRVVLRKSVNTREVSQPVELRDEDVSIQRTQISSNDQRQARETAFQRREIYIPLQREIPTTQKQVQLTEVVRAGKRVDTEQQTVSGEVRSERVEIAEVQGSEADSRSAVGSPAGSEQGSSAGPKQEQ
jgi:uncharacterized protein (TIGR02271 family)